MNDRTPSDPRLDQAAASDESLLDAHEKILGTQPPDGARYRLLPIGLLFILSGLILFSGTYLNRYAGHYSPLIFNEMAKPSNGEAAPQKVDMVALGQKEYEAVCVTCHQPTGLGMPGIYPPLAGSEWVNGDPKRVIRIVLYGLKDGIHVKGQNFTAAAMPTFGQVKDSAYNWSDEKVAAALTYVRHAFTNTAPPISADDVAAIHKALGDNRGPLTEPELEAVK